MGTKEPCFALLLNVSLEDLVPADHFYCRLERTLDLSFVCEYVHENLAGGGRPSIDPIVFFKLQLVMFFEGLRSELQLMRHADDLLSVRLYLGYAWMSHCQTPRVSRAFAPAMVWRCSVVSSRPL